MTKLEKPCNIIENSRDVVVFFETNKKTPSFLTKPRGKRWCFLIKQRHKNTSNLKKLRGRISIKDYNQMGKRLKNVALLYQTLHNLRKPRLWRWLVHHGCPCCVCMCKLTCGLRRNDPC